MAAATSKTKSHHNPTTLWALRKDPGEGYVRTYDEENLGIVFGHASIRIPRRDARLLAKRILQCMDAT